MPIVSINLQDGEEMWFDCDLGFSCNLNGPTKITVSGCDSYRHHIDNNIRYGPLLLSEKGQETYFLLKFKSNTNKNNKERYEYLHD